MLPILPLSGDALVGLEPEDCSPFPRCEAFPLSVRAWNEISSSSSGGIRGFASSQPRDFQRLAYGTIPDAHRWEAWRAVLGSSTLNHLPDFYCQLVSAGADGEWARQIKLDVPRTFAGMAAFDEEQHQRLFRILCAYTSLNPEVGYCQGMNSIAGLILFVAGADKLEEEVFWLFASLMDEGRLRDLYALGFPALQRYICSLDALMSELEPELHEHLLAQDMQPAMYLHHWFLTLFVDGLPLPTVLAFWDVIICCGVESLIKLTGSLLRCLKPMLLGQELEGIVSTFRQLGLARGPEASNFCFEVLRRSADLDLPDHVVQLLQFGSPSGDSSPGPLADPGSNLPTDVVGWWGAAKGSVRLPALPSLPSLSKLTSPRLSTWLSAKLVEGAGCRQQTRKGRSACGAMAQMPDLVSAS